MSRFSSRAILLSFVFAFVVLTTPAYSATITTYNNLSSWEAAVSGVQIDNFEGLAPAGSYTSYPSGFYQNGVEFFGLSGLGVADTSSGPFAAYNFGTGEAGYLYGGGASVQITLPSPATAFAINLFTAPAGLSYTVSVLSTPFTVPTVNQPPPGFFGATSDTPFTTVTLQASTGSSYSFFDNFQWGTSGAQTGGGSQTPEAGTFLLIGSGLLALAVARRRKVRHTH
jgi:hypothetical protein